MSDEQPEPTVTQALTQRLTASIQGETYLEVARSFDDFVSARGSVDAGVSVDVLAEFYRALRVHGLALRAIASAA